MKTKLKFYNVSGSVVNSVYYYGHKLKIYYDYNSSVINVLCVKFNDKLYSLDGKYVFNDVERNKLNKIKKPEMKKVVTSLGEYQAVRKIAYQDPTNEEFRKALEIIKANLKQEKTNIIGFPFEKVTPCFKNKDNKVLEFNQKR